MKTNYSYILESVAADSNAGLLCIKYPRGRFSVKLAQFLPCTSKDLDTLCGMIDQANNSRELVEQINTFILSAIDIIIKARNNTYDASEKAEQNAFIKRLMAVNSNLAKRYSFIQEFTDGEAVAFKAEKNVYYIERDPGKPAQIKRTNGHTFTKYGRRYYVAATQTDGKKKIYRTYCEFSYGQFITEGTSRGEAVAKIDERTEKLLQRLTYENTKEMRERYINMMIAAGYMEEPETVTEEPAEPTPATENAQKATEAAEPAQPMQTASEPENAENGATDSENTNNENTHPDREKEGTMEDNIYKTFDSTGRPIKAGDVVRIDNAYFKNDCGYWFVEQDGTNPDYNSAGLTLKKLGKTGIISKTKYNLAFWPLMCFVSDYEKNAAAKEHNKKYAKITIDNSINKAEILQFFQKELSDRKEQANYYKIRGYSEEFCKPYEVSIPYYAAAVERLTAEAAPKAEEPENKNASVVSFETGKKYYYSFAGDHDLRVVCTIISRTAQTITFTEDTKENPKTRRIFISTYGNEPREAVQPLGRYSLAPIMDAADVYEDPETEKEEPETIPAEPETEPTPAEPAADTLTEYSAEEIKSALLIWAALEDKTAHSEQSETNTAIIKALQDAQKKAAAILAAREDAQPAEEEKPAEAAQEPAAEPAAEEETETEAENATEPAELPETDYFIENKETGKIELHFEYATYKALSEDQKRTIKSNFLYSRRGNAWISRRKFPNLWYPKKIAAELGLADAGETGEALTFQEQQERKNARAEHRADRLEARAEKARAEAERLQKPINDMHGDIAFFTQPNINTSGGRRFTAQRDRMFQKFHKGVEEQIKADRMEYDAQYLRKAATAAPSASFAERRIKEAEANIRAQKRNIDLYRLNYNRDAEKRAAEIIKQEQSRIEYYKQYID